MTQTKINGRAIVLSWLVVLGLSAATDGAMLVPASYAMPNGQAGAFAYYDQAYDGTGDKTVNLAPLSGGVGELTDGLMPTSSWNVTPEPFVGWLTVNPTIRFHFSQAAAIDAMTFYFDDTEGVGGVEAPTQIVLSNESKSLTFPITNTAARGQWMVPLQNLDMVGTWLDATISKPAERWLMMSEVQLDGAYVPEPATFAWVASAGLLLGARRGRSKLRVA